MEINDWYSAFRCYPYNTNYPKQSFPFYVQIKHRSTVHTILIVTPPIPATHQNTQLGIDRPCIQSCSQKFCCYFCVCGFCCWFCFFLKQKSICYFTYKYSTTLCTEQMFLVHMSKIYLKKISNFLEAKSNYILRTLENPSYLEVHVQVQETSHNPPFQSPSEAIQWHVPWQPACSSTRSQQWGSSDPLKYNNAKCTAQITVFLLVQTNMERHLSHQLPEVFRTWLWSNESEGKSHLYTSLLTPHNCC